LGHPTPKELFVVACKTLGQQKGLLVVDCMALGQQKGWRRP
jgi:hypothetical protein